MWKTSGKATTTTKKNKIKKQKKTSNNKKKYVDVYEPLTGNQCESIQKAHTQIYGWITLEVAYFFLFVSFSPQLLQRINEHDTLFPPIFSFRLLAVSFALTHTYMMNISLYIVLYTLGRWLVFIIPYRNYIVVLVCGSKKTKSSPPSDCGIPIFVILLHFVLFAFSLDVLKYLYKYNNRVLCVCAWFYFILFLLWNLEDRPEEDRPEELFSTIIFLDACRLWWSCFCFLFGYFT